MLGTGRLGPSGPVFLLSLWTLLCRALYCHRLPVIPFELGICLGLPLARPVAQICWQPWHLFQEQEVILAPAAEWGRAGQGHLLQGMALYLPDTSKWHLPVLRARQAASFLSPSLGLPMALVHFSIVSCLTSDNRKDWPHPALA